MLHPVIPEPMITTSALSTNLADCTCTKAGKGGVCVQNEVVGDLTGRFGDALMRERRVVNDLFVVWISERRARMLRYISRMEDRIAVMISGMGLKVGAEVFVEGK